MPSSYPPRLVSGKRPRSAHAPQDTRSVSSETAVFTHDCKDIVSRRAHCSSRFPVTDTVNAIPQKEALVCVFRYMAGGVRSTSLTSRAYQQARDIAALASSCVAGRRAFSAAFDAIDIRSDDVAVWRSDGSARPELNGHVLGAWCRLLRYSLLRFSCQSSHSCHYIICHIEELLLSLASCNRLQYLALNCAAVPYLFLSHTLRRIQSSLLGLHVPFADDGVELFEYQQDSPESSGMSFVSNSSVTSGTHSYTLACFGLRISHAPMSTPYNLRLRSVTVNYLPSGKLLDMLSSIALDVVDLNIIIRNSLHAPYADFDLACVCAQLPYLSRLRLENFDLSAEAVSILVDSCPNLDAVALAYCQFRDCHQFRQVVLKLTHRLTEFCGSPTAQMLLLLAEHCPLIEHLEIDDRNVASEKVLASMYQARLLSRTFRSLKHLTLSQCAKSCRWDAKGGDTFRYELPLLMTLIHAGHTGDIELQHLGLKGFTCMTAEIYEPILEAVGSSLKSIELDGCTPLTNSSAAVLLSRHAQNIESVLSFPNPWEVIDCNQSTLNVLHLFASRCSSLCLDSHCERVRDCLPSRWEEDYPTKKYKTTHSWTENCCSQSDTFREFCCRRYCQVDSISA